MEETIKTHALKRMPPGVFVRFERVETMRGEVVRAIVWSFVDRRGTARLSAFDAETGEYLTEMVV